MYILFRLYLQFYLFSFGVEETWILMIKVYVTAMKKGFLSLKLAHFIIHFLLLYIVRHNNIHNYILCECMNNKNYCI